MKNEYIVITKKGVNQDRFLDILRNHEIDINANFNALERHYLVSFAASKVTALMSEPDVLLVEAADRVVQLMETQVIELNQQGWGGNWGLNRIDSRDWNDATWYPNKGSYTYFRDGNNVDIYIVDSGCRITHKDFENRANIIYDHYNSKIHPEYGIDRIGHGTHVASITAGKKYGVAKKANLLISKVFDTGGASLAAIVSGINACLEHHNNKIKNGITTPSIMNLSLGGPANASEEQAINDCIDSGIICVAAAGNDGKNLDDTTYDVFPAEIARAITVGSVDIQDHISEFSNYGKVVDVFAPGHFIVAAHYQNDFEENMLSGTSMAAPHVSGVCALYIQDTPLQNNSTYVKEVHDWVHNNATQNTLQLTEDVNQAGTANRLLYSEYVNRSTHMIEPELEPITVVDIKIGHKTAKEVVTSDPVITITHTDRFETNIEPNNDTRKITFRDFVELTTITITTTVTEIKVTTTTYSDGSKTVIDDDPVSNTTSTDSVTSKSWTDIINEEIIPAPIVKHEPIQEINNNPEPVLTPIPFPKPKTHEQIDENDLQPPKPKLNWRRKGRARQVRQLIRLVNRVERWIKPEWSDIKDLVEQSAEDAVNSQGKDRIDAYNNVRTTVHNALLEIRKRRNNK